MSRDEVATQAVRDQIARKGLLAKAQHQARTWSHVTDAIMSVRDLVADSMGTTRRGRLWAADWLTIVNELRA